METDIEHLLKLAKEATPGPWVAKPRLIAGRECDCEIVGNQHPQYRTNTPVCKLSTGFVWYEGDKAFIAACNPIAIHKLCEEVVSLRKAWQSAHELREQIGKLQRDVEEYKELLTEATCLEAKLRGEIQTLEKLAYLGEHHFPDLTYKARLDELVQQHRSLEAENAKLRAVAEAARLHVSQFGDGYTYGTLRDALAALDKKGA